MSIYVAQIVLALTVGVLAFLIPFAGHRGYLLWLRRRRTPPSLPDAWEGPLPTVTVQLPVYNERNVVGRLVDAACRLRYPRDKLEIQLLDDSTDETTERARERVRHWRSRGVEIELIRRENREGYKAGALQNGLERAEGEFILILDADFVPDPDLLRRVLPPFADPEIGMVQARWDHLNEEESWMTRAQALLLDGHFFLEQGGRYRGRRFFNFNGTAGIWRRRCLEEAGGWEADTLTEDLDLSYRAQMAGWRFAFLEDVGVPAEIPSRAGSLEVQQRRWAQGGIQTARKILPRLLRGPWSWPVKLEATVHLLGHLAHPLTLVLGLLLLPSAVARRALGLEHLLSLDLLVFAAATVPFLFFYATAGRARARPWSRLLPDVARTLALGVGLSAPVSRAVLRGFRTTEDGFVRTPKSGSEGSVPPATEATEETEGTPGANEKRTTVGAGGYGGGSRPGDTALKLGLGAVMVAYGIGAVAAEMYASLPFIALFGGGWLALGIAGLGTGSGAEGARASSEPLRHPGDPLPGQEEEGWEPEEGPEPGGLRPHPALEELSQAPVAEECEAA